MAPRRLGQRPRRHPREVALHAEVALDLVVVRREIVVGQRPVGDVGARDRPVQRAAVEVLAPEARHLGIPVHGPSADRRREVVDVAHERPRDPAPRLRLGALRPRLEQRVLVLEEARLLDLVVGERRPDRSVAPEPGQEVAALLEDQHRVARRARSAQADTAPPAPEPTTMTGSLPAALTARAPGAPPTSAARRPAGRPAEGASARIAAACARRASRGPAGGAGRVGVVTCAREKPSGWRSPGQFSRRQPTRAWLPPYSGGPSVASSAWTSGDVDEPGDQRLAAGGQQRVLDGGRSGGERRRPAPARERVQARQAGPVDLLQPDDGAGELARALSARALQADAPAELGLAVERVEVGEVVVPGAGAIRERAARVDQRRIDLEGAEEEVDRLGGARLERARRRGRPAGRAAAGRRPRAAPRAPRRPGSARAPRAGRSPGAAPPPARARRARAASASRPRPATPAG